MICDALNLTYLRSFLRTSIRSLNEYGFFPLDLSFVSAALPPRCSIALSAMNQSLPSHRRPDLTAFGLSVKIQMSPPLEPGNGSRLTAFPLGTEILSESRIGVFGGG